LRWLGAIISRFSECKRSGNLQPADRAVGAGPFHARLRAARARIVGPGVISGIREIWVRDVYLHGGFLSIPPDAQVVDLGANVGNFTMLALGHGPDVRVIAVEPSQQCRQMLARQLEENGWSTRVRVCDAFIGSRNAISDELLSSPDFAQSRFISEQEFVDAYGISRIDFLKCDIEGSEFGLLTEQSQLLARTQRLAMELHDHSGDRNAFIDMLKRNGFEVLVLRDSPTDCIVLARRKQAIA
jgi:FkbM family methyltransferase